MLTQLLNLPVTIVRRQSSGSTDELGNATSSETEVEATAEIQQRQRGEHDDAVAQSDWIGFFHPDEDIDSSDRVVCDLGTFEVIGDPWPVRNPRGQAVSHIEASLNRTAGPEDAS